MVRVPLVVAGFFFQNASDSEQHEIVTIGGITLGGICDAPFVSTPIL